MDDRSRDREVADWGTDNTEFEVHQTQMELQHGTGRGGARPQDTEPPNEGK
jgi:hypothetical protein